MEQRTLILGACATLRVAAGAAWTLRPEPPPPEELVADAEPVEATMTDQEELELMIKCRVPGSRVPGTRSLKWIEDVPRLWKSIATDFDLSTAVMREANDAVRKSARFC